MIFYLKTLLKDRPKRERLSVTELFERQHSRKAIICLFLAILEMVKLQAIAVVQKDAFSDISIRRHKGFDQLLASEEAISAIEEGYN
jgi:segregation and condensation protein A